MLTNPSVWPQVTSMASGHLATDGELMKKQTRKSIRSNMDTIKVFNLLF